MVLLLVFSIWLGEWWSKLYFVLLRPMLKWCIRIVTGKCELLRISYEENDKVKRIMRIENSLKHSKYSELAMCTTSIDFDVSDSVRQIIAIKDVVPDVHPRFETALTDSLFRIKAYSKILAQAEDLRKIKYSTDNVEHETQLSQLWNLYHSNIPQPGRVGPHWTEMGFQGHDPSTDFRGMGMLGLEQLIFFASVYPDQARHILSQSHHPQYGFSFAIVGINITEMGFSLLFKRKLRPYFYTLEKREQDIIDFHQFYCHLIYKFVQFWVAEKPRDIMEFSRIRKKFHKRVKASLKDYYGAEFSSIHQEIS